MSSAVLVIDDEANIRRMVAGLLQQEGYRVDGAPDGNAGLSALEHDEVDVVLLDLVLPGDDGLTVLQRIVQRHPGIPVVMMSGRATLGDAVRATRLGAFHFIEKPLSPDAVLLTVNSALTLRRAQDTTRALTAELGGMPLPQIAEKLGSNTNSLYKLLHDARKKLRRGLEAAGFTSDDVREAWA